MQRKYLVLIIIIVIFVILLAFLFIKTKQEPSPLFVLSVLTEDYNEFAQLLDKKILTHDVDEVLRLHDELLIKLSNKQINETEMSRGIKQLINKLEKVSYAPPAHLKNWQGKKLLPTDNKAYFGNWQLRSFLLSKDYLGADMAFAKVFNSGSKFLVSYIDIPIQDNTGRFQNMDESVLWAKIIIPPPALIIKSRLRMGAIPMIQLHLYDNNTEGWFKEAGLSINKKEQLDVTDVVNGALDSYLEKQINILDAIDYPIVVLFINEFNLDARKLFGQSGKEVFTNVSEKYGEQALYNQYGDKSTPDGPERVRDAWIRLKKIMDKTGASSHISLASHVSGGYQNKIFNIPALIAQWNKIKYYWPGEGVIDYIGMSAYGYALNKNKNDMSLYASAYYWWQDIKNGPWKNTPTFFNEFSPNVETDFPGYNDPQYMPKYVKYVLKDIVPNDFPVSFVLFITPPFPMDMDAEINAFKEAVINNNFYAGSVKVK